MWDLGFGICLCLTLASSVGAQQSDPAAADQRPTPPPAAPATPEPTFADKARQWVDDNKLIERLDGTADGWYPRLGGIRRGSGFGGGPGYRMHAAGNVRIDLSAAISVRNYRAFDARVRWLQTPKRRAELWTDYSYDNFPRERFFGYGVDTSRVARASYGFRNNTVAIRSLMRPTSHVEITALVGYMHPDVDRGSDTEHRPLADAFTDAQVAGLASQPSFVQTQVAVDLDLRDAPGNPTHGGVYRVAFSRWDDHDSNAFDFRRIEATATQFVPVTSGRRHLVSVRGGLDVATADSDARVPFYFLPYIGGQDTLRSHAEYRYSGEDALWYGPEYTWNPRPYFSLAAFMDAGKVARSWNGLGSADTKTGYGFGLIGHTSKQILARLDFGFGGGEGLYMWFSFGSF